MTSYCCDMLKEYKQHLSPQQIEQIKKEIKDELDICESYGKTLGMQMDHDAWKNFLQTF